MSSTNRGSKRHPQDFYATPAWCVRALLADPVACSLLPGGTWMDPCAGDGAILRAVSSAWAPAYRPLWYAAELRDESLPALQKVVSAGHLFRGDFLAQSFHQPAPLDVIFTNPPYSLAQEFVEKSLTLAPTVCMLLRLNFLGGAKRAAFWRDNVPDVFVLPNRPSFTGGGKTDSTEYGWFIWPDPRQLHTRSRARSSGLLRVLGETPRLQRTTKRPTVLDDEVLT